MTDGQSQIIDITDLRAPILTPIQQGALEATGAVPLTFSVDAVLEAARAQTGLSDFGDLDFLERLQMWLQALDEDKNASSVTRLNTYQMTVRYAATRLRLEDFIRRNPAVLDVEIDRPIIVAGLPRSGTTHMLALLSADQRLRSLPWWEAIAPIPGLEDAPTAADPNPRYTRADQGWQQFEALLPHMAVMHEFSADHISEDIELQALDFSSYLIEWLALVPRWRDFYLGRDQSGTYAYLKRALQALTYLRGPNRWVIKCPQHMEQLPVLQKTFPDATFVITHRDPVASIQSAMTMWLYAARVFRKTIDPEEPKNYWIDRYERLLRACVRDRDVLPESQSLDVYFHEWIKAPDPILREIYARADLPLTDAALADLHAYLAQHDGGDRRRIRHDLQRDFGITAEDIRRRFAFYFDRFPVQAEVR